MSILLSLLIVLVAFQNCDSPAVVSENDPGVESKNVPSEAIALEYKSESFQEQTRDDGSTFSVLSQNAQYLVLASGQLTSSTVTGDVPGPSKDLGCLKADKLVEIKSLLEEGRLCKAPKITDPDILCNQMITESYADIVFSSDKVMLGYKINGCAETTVFCGDTDTLFRSIIQEIATRPSDFLEPCP